MFGPGLAFDEIADEAREGGGEIDVAMRD